MPELFTAPTHVAPQPGHWARESTKSPPTATESLVRIVSPLRVASLTPLSGQRSDSGRATKRASSSAAPRGRPANYGLRQCCDHVAQPRAEVRQQGPGRCGGMDGGKQQVALVEVGVKQRLLKQQAHCERKDVRHCHLLRDEGAQIRRTEFAQRNTPQRMHPADQRGRVRSRRRPVRRVQLIERPAEVQQMVHRIHSRRNRQGISDSGH